MQTVRLPNTDLDVTRLCFGCWGIISDAHQGERDESTALLTMRAAIDAGINFFDTAPMYGNGASEILLGKFLAENQLRDSTVIATKIRPENMTADAVVKECEDSLVRLQTDRIDLLQTHWTNPDVPLEESWQAMCRLRDQGKVRAIGVSNAGPKDLATTIAVEKPITNQLPYNLLSRMIESEIVPKCVANEIGILVYSPLLHGILSGRYQSAEEVPDGRARTRHFSSSRPMTRHSSFGLESETFGAIAAIRKIASDLGRTMADVALAWLVAKPGITSVIAGAGTPEQLHANVSFMDSPLAEESVQHLDSVTEELRKSLDGNPDMWDEGENARYQ